MEIQAQNEARMNIPSLRPQNIPSTTLPIQEALFNYTMFGQIRKDEMQTCPTDGPCSNELLSYSSTQPKNGIANNLKTLVLNCSHAAATVMDKLSIPQPESLHQKMKNIIQEPPPEQHDASTSLCTGTIEYSIPGVEFMYQFSGCSDLYVGLEDKVRPDQKYIDHWEQQVRPRLYTDIKEFERKIRRASRTLPGRPGLSVSPELRMSGYVEATNKVKLLPCIWILYNHQRWKKSVHKFVKELEWLSCEGFGNVEVRLGGPRLSALENLCKIPGLDFDDDHMYYLDGQTTLYLHVEKPKGGSACGMLACATVMRDGAVMSQRLSRIGGLLCVNFETLGVTTAHGMLEWFVEDSLYNKIGNEPSDDESWDSPLSSDDEEGEMRSVSSTTFDGTNCLRQWSQVSALGLTSFLQTNYYCLSDMSPMIQQKGIYDVTCDKASREGALCSDFSLLDLQHAGTLQNTYTIEDGQKAVVEALASGHDAAEGPVQLLLGIDNLVQGFLLPGTMSFFVHGTQFETRKIRTTKPLGLGCSGTWVVRDRQLQGIVIASYTYEPYVHMITTDDLLNNIKATCPDGEIKLPHKPVSPESKVTESPTFEAVSKPDKLRQLPGSTIETTVSPVKTKRRQKHKRSKALRSKWERSLNEHVNCILKRTEASKKEEPYNLGELDAETLINCFMKDELCLVPRCFIDSLTTFMPSDVPKHFDESRWKVPEATTSQIDYYRSLGSREPSHESLTTGQLYLKLRDEAVSLSNPSTGLNSSALHSTKGKCAVRTYRGLIFIKDLDSYSMAALMLTAGQQQRDVLGDAFYYHVAFKPHIHIPPRRRSMGSQLSFHLPMYLWRSGPMAPQDLRSNAKGSPVRMVNQLEGQQHRGLDSEHGEYLCQAQVSLILKTTSDGVWTCYCFQDAYHLPEGHDEAELLADWEDGFDPTDWFDAGPLLPDPWESFLIAFEKQLRVFRREWRRTVDRFSQMINAYIDTSITQLPPKETSRWLVQTFKQLSELSMSLESTVHCWDIIHCTDHPQSRTEQLFLLKIHRLFSDVRLCSNDLESLMSLIGDYHCLNSLAIYDIEKSPQNNPTLCKTLLRLLFYITFTSAMLSMQQKAIPHFLKPDRLVWIVLVSGLLVAVCLILGQFYNWILTNRKATFHGESECEERDPELADF